MLNRIFKNTEFCEKNDLDLNDFALDYILDSNIYILTNV